MIIELVEQSSKSKWQFDDVGPIFMEQIVDSLTAIRWAKGDETSGQCPMVPASILTRYEAVKKKASGSSLVVV